MLQLYVFSAKACCTAALPGFVHTAPVGTQGTLVLLLWQISSRGGSCAACITPQAASLSFAFQSRAIWAASLFFKNTFLVFQYWHLQLQCMVLSYTSYVALPCTDCCRNTWEISFFLNLFISFSTGLVPIPKMFLIQLLFELLLYIVLWSPFLSQPPAPNKFYL